MERGTKTFWALIVALASASIFFGVSAERAKTSARHEALLSDGELVRVTRVIDGDTVVVQTDGNESAAVRLVGVKSFDATQKFDDASRFGALAIDELRHAAEDGPVRVVLNRPPQDKHGRTLAHLYAGENDLGLQLIKKGLALTYTVYPFPSMALYAEEQARAQAERRGLWGDPRVATRAELLERQWRRESR